MPAESFESSEGELVIVDADARFAEAVAHLFRARDWQVVVEARPPARLPPTSSALIMDVCPTGVPQTSALERMTRARRPGRIVALTGYPSLPLAVAAFRAGAEACLVKPVSPLDLARLLSASPIGHLRSPDGAPPSLDPTEQGLPSLARMEWEYISRVLQAVDGNISLAARVLKIERSTLQRKLKKYPPSW